MEIMLILTFPVALCEVKIGVKNSVFCINKTAGKISSYEMKMLRLPRITLSEEHPILPVSCNVYP